MLKLALFRSRLFSTLLRIILIARSGITCVLSKRPPKQFEDLRALAFAKTLSRGKFTQPTKEARSKRQKEANLLEDRFVLHYSDIGLFI